MEHKNVLNSLNEASDPKFFDGATTDDTEDLELAMLMYNLLEYNSNYSDMTVSLWF